MSLIPSNPTLHCVYCTNRRDLTRDRIDLRNRRFLSLAQKSWRNVCVSINEWRLIQIRFEPAHNHCLSVDFFLKNKWNKSRDTLLRHHFNIIQGLPLYDIWIMLFHPKRLDFVTEQAVQSWTTRVSWGVFSFKIVYFVSRLFNGKIFHGF